MSLVEVSLSTVTALKVRSAVLLSMDWSTDAGIAASVKTKPSMVPMFGMIMPEPLAMPAMTTSVPPIDVLRDDPLGKVSVVMMASAAAGQSSGVSAATALGRQPVMQSTGSGSPITPVEARKTSRSAQPKRRAAAAAVRSTASTPAAPVKALALPELTTMARAVP